MKKLMTAFLAIVCLSSCGGSSLSPEAINAKAQQKFEAMQTALDQEAANNCEDKMDEYITFYKDSIEKAQVRAAVPTMDMNQ